VPTAGEYLRRVYVLEMDEERCARIADATGGRYFHAATPPTRRSDTARSDVSEEARSPKVRYLQYREHYPLLVEAGAGLMMLARSRRRRPGGGCREDFRFAEPDGRCLLWAVSRSRGCWCGSTRVPPPRCGVHFHG